MYGLTEVHKSDIIEPAINTQKNEVFEIFEPNDLKIRPIVGSPTCLTRKLG